MNVLFDGRVVSQTEVKLSLADRGFQYGDGVFETIIYQESKLSFLDLHWDRLTRGMEALQIEKPDWLSIGFLNKSIPRLCQMQRVHPARIKLMAWRRMGGLYTPTRQSAHILITAHPHIRPPGILEKAGFSTTVKLIASLTSRFKTMSSIPYVLAGIEKTQRTLDEILIPDVEGHIGEAGASNLFWIKDGRFFTPSLETGCIAGVRRRHLIDKILKSGTPVEEVMAHPEDLLQADNIFTCNVSGIGWIKSIDNQTFEVDRAGQLEDEYDLRLG